MLRACSVCGGKTELSPPPILCLDCGRADTYVEVGESAPARVPKPSVRRSLADDPPDIERVATGFPDVDALLEGGPASGATTLIYGGPGSGKSTFGLRVAAGCARSIGSSALVVCPEMSHTILTHTARKAGVELERLIRCEQPELWEVEVLDSRVVLVDSLSRMRNGAATLARILDWARERNAVALCLAHQTREGEAMGGAGVGHDPDAVLRVTRDEDTDERRLYVEKSRTCGVGMLVLNPKSPKRKGRLRLL